MHDRRGRSVGAGSDQDYYALNPVLAQSGLPADWTPLLPLSGETVNVSHFRMTVCDMPLST